MPYGNCKRCQAKWCQAEFTPAQFQHGFIEKRKIFCLALFVHKFLEAFRGGQIKNRLNSGKDKIF